MVARQGTQKTDVLRRREPSLSCLPREETLTGSQGLPSCPDVRPQLDGPSRSPFTCLGNCSQCRQEGVTRLSTSVWELWMGDLSFPEMAMGEAETQDGPVCPPSGPPWSLFPEDVQGKNCHPVGTAVATPGDTRFCPWVMSKGAGTALRLKASPMRAHPLGMPEATAWQWGRRGRSGSEHLATSRTG